MPFPKFQFQEVIPIDPEDVNTVGLPAHTFVEVNETVGSVLILTCTGMRIVPGQKPT